MSKTLNFAQNLYDMGRNLQERGQAHAAARLLSRLSSFGELPKDLAEETHIRLAELHIKGGRFKKARRRLAAVLALQQDNAHGHFLMAGAALEDEACDPRRALAHYRRCVKLDPDNPAYNCAFGLLAVRQGETEAGLKALRRVEKLAPDDHDLLAQVVQGLWEEGERDEATRIARTALFRHPRNPKFRALWARHQFQLLHDEQNDRDLAGGLSSKRGPVFLPFVRPTSEDNPPAANKKQIRRDSASVLRPYGRRKERDRSHNNSQNR